MEVIVSRCAGLDVHTNTVMACVRVPGPNGGRTSTVRRSPPSARSLTAGTTVRQMPERGVRAPRCDRRRCCPPRCCPNLAARVVASGLSPANRPRRGPGGGRRVGCESGRPCRTRFGPRAGALASNPPRHVPSRIIGCAAGAQQPTGCAGERVPTATSRTGGRPRQDPFGRQGQQPKLLTTRRPRRHPKFWAWVPAPMCTRCHPRALPWQAPVAT